MRMIESRLDRKRYLSALKVCRTGGYPMFSEGVTGIVIGPFFSMAYYSPYEWNRRITHECNRAWGYVKEADGKTQVHFIRGKGLLTPSLFLLITLLCYLIFLFGLDFNLFVVGHPLVIFSSFGIALFTCLTTAIASCFTDEGIYGEAEIERMLENPQEYYC